jgi:hypothetical protein
MRVADHYLNGITLQPKVSSWIGQLNGFRSAFRLVSGKAQRSRVTVLRKRVETPSGAARGVLRGP